MSVRAIPGGFEAFRRDKYEYRCRRIFKTKDQALAYDETIKRERKKKGLLYEGPAILTLSDFIGTQTTNTEDIGNRKTRTGTTEHFGQPSQHHVVMGDSRPRCQHSLGPSRDLVP